MQYCYSQQNYDASREYQLIVYLHGAGGIGNDNKRQINNCMLLERLVSDEYIESHPCIIVAPQTSQWWIENQLITAMNIVKEVDSKYNIDDERKVLIGCSMGGAAVWDMLFLYPDYFDAAVPVSGDVYIFNPSRTHMLDNKSIYDNVNSIKDIAIWIFHGTNDNVIDIGPARKMYKILSSVGGNVYMTENPTAGHNSNLIAFSTPTFYNWLFSEDFKLPDRKENTLLTAPVLIAALSAAATISLLVTISIVAAKRQSAKKKSSGAEK